MEGILSFLTRFLINYTYNQLNIIFTCSFKASSAHGQGVQMPKWKVSGSGFPDPAAGNGLSGVPIITTLRIRIVCLLIGRIIGMMQDAPGRGNSFVNCK